jgi:hypothetical protein
MLCPYYANFDTAQSHAEQRFHPKMGVPQTPQEAGAPGSE